MFVSGVKNLIIWLVWSENDKFEERYSYTVDSMYGGHKFDNLQPSDEAIIAEVYDDDYISLIDFAYDRDRYCGIERYEYLNQYYIPDVDGEVVYADEVAYDIKAKHHVIEGSDKCRALLKECGLLTA